MFEMDVLAEGGGARLDDLLHAPAYARVLRAIGGRDEVLEARPALHIKERVKERELAGARGKNSLETGVEDGARALCAKAAVEEARERHRVELLCAGRLPRPLKVHSAGHAIEARDYEAELGEGDGVQLRDGARIAADRAA